MGDNLCLPCPPQAAMDDVPPAMRTIDPAPPHRLPGAAGAPTRICIYGAPSSAVASERLLRRLPQGARVSLFGTCAEHFEGLGGAERVPDRPSGKRPRDLLLAAAARHPGEHLVLLDSALALPELAIERLLRALDTPDVLGTIPLDGGCRSPLPEDLLQSADVDRLDALCFAWSERHLVDDPWFPDAFPRLSAWHGERILELGAERLLDRDALALAGLRVVALDHVYVGGLEERTARAAEAPEDERMPPSAFSELGARIAPALALAARPGRPGLSGKPVLLHLLHGWGGGAERWVRDFAAADTHAEHLVLVARGSTTRRRCGEWLELLDGRLFGPPLRRWPLPRPIADTALADSGYRALFGHVLHAYCVDAIMVSSLIGHSLDALRSGLPLIQVVHDHYPLWPLLHRDFGDPTLRFDGVQLEADLRDEGFASFFANRDPAHWRALRQSTVGALVAASASLIAPSHSALANHLRLAPELDKLASCVIPHGLAPWPTAISGVRAPPARARLRLVIPGRLQGGKGSELLRALLPMLDDRVELFLLGAGAAGHEFFAHARVHVILGYARDELPDLLARIRPDAALLLPSVAETFSYTLSELRSLGVPVIATRIGALAERIEDGVSGLLVEPRAAAVAELLQSLLADRSPLARLRHGAAAERAHDSATMAREYARTLDLGARHPLRYPLHEVDPAALEASVRAAQLRSAAQQQSQTLAELARTREESARRGEWGHALGHELGELREEYRREITLAGEKLDAVHAELEERSSWALTLNAELQDLKPRYEQMLGSLSWRITAPLRSARTRLRVARTNFSFRLHRAAALWGRLRGSLARRGVSGTAARIAQEWQQGAPAPVAAPPEPRLAENPPNLPASAAPRVSIVIPVYNKIAWTEACLRSLAEHAGPVPFEVIVVDDASSDETAERLLEVGGIQSIRNVHNLGFIGSCNAGAAAARGEYLLFLNNDTVVTAGWLEALVDCIEEAPRAGLVGARLVYPDGRLQEAGGIVFSDGAGWNVGRFENSSDPRYGFRREVDYCSGAAILLRRELFEELGRFDTRYAPAYYEDTDLAFAVRAAGFKVYCEPSATVIHFEGVTSGTDTASGTKRYQVINQEKFVAKWRDALRSQPAPGTPIPIAATHRARKRVLMIDATTPAPDQDSGSVRIVNLMRVLMELGCQVSFLPENRAWSERYTPPLQRLGVEALYAPYAQDPVKLLRERGGEFDLVIISRHYVAASFVGLVRQYAPQARLAFDTVDLHYLREQRAAALEGSAELARIAAATREKELKIIAQSDVTLVVSEAEQELLARDAPDARVEVLSNVHEIRGCRRPFAERRDLVFVGGFQHPPNVDAVRWFVGEVFARIRTELPELRCHIIGSRMPDSIRALADAQTLMHGWVEDILPLMDGCRVSIAPLRYGAGVKGKINMAMSCGLPVVATPVAVEGMHVEPGREVLVANDAAGFAAAVVRLYRDEALWNQLSAQGLVNVERHFSFAAAREAIRPLLD